MKLNPIRTDPHLNLTDSSKSVFFSATYNLRVDDKIFHRVYKIRSNPVEFLSHRTANYLRMGGL